MKKVTAIHYKGYTIAPVCRQVDHLKTHGTHFAMSLKPREYRITGPGMNDIAAGSIDSAKHQIDCAVRELQAEGNKRSYRSPAIPRWDY